MARTRPPNRLRAGNEFGIRPRANVYIREACGKARCWCVMGVVAGIFADGDFGEAASVDVRGERMRVPFCDLRPAPEPNPTYYVRHKRSRPPTSDWIAAHKITGGLHGN